MKPQAVLVVSRVPTTKMISSVLQLDVMNPKHGQVCPVGVHPVVSVALTSNFGSEQNPGLEDT